MHGEVLLGIDVGTTFSKAAVVSLEGRELSHGRAPTSWQPVPTGAEIHPDDLFAGALTAARRALEPHDAVRVLGVGVASMAEAGVLLDGKRRPVSPTIVWHDTRGDAEAREVAQGVGAESFIARTGREVSRLCSIAKYRWLRAHHPEAARGVRWLNVSEWVVRCLGGEEVGELSLASRTGFLDIEARSWWDEALGCAGAPRDLLPEPHPAGTPAGKVGAALPEGSGAVLTVAGLDHSAASVGAGATGDGDLFDSCGTAEALLRPVAPPLASHDLLRAVRGGLTVDWHVLPDRLNLVAGFESGLAMHRILELLGATEDDRRAALDRAALAITPGAEGVLIEGITEDRATISGIPRRPSPGHLWRATLEAVAARGVDLLSVIESVAGDTERIVVTGGAARSETVRHVKRSTLGEFVSPAVEEAGARGAALLAGIAAGVYASIEGLPPMELLEEAVDPRYPR